ncbi:MAG: nicotinate-nucleotide adenylyltransferase [Lachnospiraceae bacterium]|nr:nicotinate-nucleotide adenylyltransferase [Lachnospiraceae bacterium]
MKIGIFGGTFDPIHNGHIHIAKEALSQFDLDKVIFIPSGNSYMKSDVTPAIHRFNMLKLAVEDIEKFETSDIEIKRPGYTYTKDTVIELKKLYPNDELYFLVGTDTLFNIEKWYEPQFLFDNLIFLVADRNDSESKKKVDYLKFQFNAEIEFLNNDFYDISSSEIREYIKKNGYSFEDKRISENISSEVLEYIKSNHLYLDMNEKEMVELLSKDLKESRLIHTLGVMDMACKLAKIYNVDNKKATVAALLHDCAKYMDFNEKLAICERNFEELNEFEKQSDSLLHAKAGAWYAYEKYGIKDKEILDAIKFHTTGRPDMNMLEKIIFISDFIEVGRTHSEKLPMYRMIATVDIDLVCMNILKDISDYLNSNEETKKLIDPMTEETYKFYKKLISDRESKQ